MNIRKRLLSFIICGVMAFSACPLTAFADDSVYTGGLCEHHREHNEECGYIEAAEESPCTHEHTEECYRLVTDCVHEHTEKCYLDGILPAEGEEKTADGCAHVCSEESGCVTKELDCEHEHSEECGYVPAIEGNPCGYWCEICAGETEKSDKADVTDEIEETDEIDKTEEIDETDETEESEKSFSPMSERAITPTMPGGEGTNENPYQISTAEELYWFAQKVNNGGDNDAACAVLMNDIDLNPGITFDEDGTYTGGTLKQWTPIGKGSASSYKGTFNGNGKTISGLYIDSDAEYIGLFGYIGNGATVKKVGIVDSYVNGTGEDPHVGAICGYNSGTVEYCYNTGNVSGTMFAGGVCGYNMDTGKIDRCYNTGTVSSTGASFINNYVGGICGRNNGTITNCYNTGTVSGSSSARDINYVGGVCGNNSSTVTNCYNTGTVSGSGIDNNSYAGGVCGINHTTVTNCYNTGAVSSTTAGGSNYAGGVCGINYTTVTNCYNTGAVSGIYAGGVCGWNRGGTVENCYNTGTVSGTTAGGVCGWNRGGTVENCYFLSGTASSGVGGGSATDTATALTVKQMTGSAAKDNMTGFDFDTVWRIKPGISTMAAVEVALSYYPYLKVFGPESAPIGQTESVNIMDKDEEGSFLIYSKEDLKDFAAIVNGTLSEEKQAAYEEVYTDLDFDKPITNINAKLMDNIVLNKDVLDEYGNLNNGTFDQWTPIGSESKPYTGTFDGDGHTISGLYVDSNDQEVGLFGCVGKKGKIQNVGVVDSYISATGDKVCVGGVCGYNVGGTIENCYNTGTITATAQATGIYSSVGGVCGFSFWNIFNCYNTGKVSVTGDRARVGGVSGFNGKDIKNCYNTGEVSVAVDGGAVGGVCGDNDSWSRITNCYNTGKVSVTGDNAVVGGVCGMNANTIKNCYFLTGTADKGTGDDTGEATEKTDSQFKSGEVAWLLQNGQEEQVWGQKIGVDELPRLSYNKDDKVCKVTFMNGGDEVKTVYINMGKTIEEPDIDVGSGFYVDGWYTDSDLDGDEWDFENDTIDDDITLYADVEERKSSGGGSYSLSEGTDRDEPEEQPEYRPDEPSTPETPGFIDVDIFDWYHDGVMYVTENGIMNGVGGNRFEPEAELKREMLAVILWNMTDNPEPNGIAPFLDVTSDKYYAKAIAWANENGVMYGYGEEFGVGEAVTREDFAAILYRYAAFKGYDTTQGGMAIREFIDFDQIADYAVEALGWAVNSGIISGMGDGTVSPKTSTYRGQAAVMLMKFCENIMK